MHQFRSALPKPTSRNDRKNSNRAARSPIATSQPPIHCVLGLAPASHPDSLVGAAKPERLQALERIQRLVAARTLALPAWLHEAETNDLCIDGEDAIIAHQLDEADRAVNGRRYTARRKALKWLDALSQAALKSQRPEVVRAVHDLVDLLGAATYRSAHFGANEIASACVFLPPPNEFYDRDSFQNFSRSSLADFANAGGPGDARHYGFGVTHDRSILVDIVPKPVHTQLHAGDEIRSATSHAAVWKTLEAVSRWQVSESTAIISALPRSVAALESSPRNPYTDVWIAALAALLRNHRSNIEALGFNHRHVKRWSTQMLRANLSVNLFRELHEALDQRLLSAIARSPAVFSVAAYNALANGSGEDIAPNAWQMLIDEPLAISAILEQADLHAQSPRSAMRHSAAFAAPLTSYQGDTPSGKQVLTELQL